jgi:hypothetical protein
MSDYYQGPVRDVFVGGLTAAGGRLVIYNGSARVEEYALDLAGARIGPTVRGLARTTTAEVAGHLAGSGANVANGLLRSTIAKRDWRAHWLGEAES